MEQQSMDAGSDECGVMVAPQCNYPHGYQITLSPSLGFVLSLLLCFVVVFESGYHFVAHAVLRLVTILLPLPFK